MPAALPSHLSWLGRPWPCVWPPKASGAPKIIWANASAAGKHVWEPPKAITAMAHNLARILWHLVRHRQAYDPKIWAAAAEKLKAKRLQQTAAAFGMKIICNPTT